MRSVVAIVSAGLFCVAACALSGCETGRANKLHASFESASDVSTTPIRRRIRVDLHRRCRPFPIRRPAPDPTAASR